MEYKAKYVVGVPRDSMSGDDELIAVIFHEDMVHKSCRQILYAIQSAGFFQLKDGDVVVSGKSESLGVGPAEGDEELIARALCLAPRKQVGDIMLDMLRKRQPGTDHKDYGPRHETKKEKAARQSAELKVQIARVFDAHVPPIITSSNTQSIAMKEPERLLNLTAKKATAKQLKAGVVDLPDNLFLEVKKLWETNCGGDCVRIMEVGSELCKIAIFDNENAIEHGGVPTRHILIPETGIVSQLLYNYLTQAGLIPCYEYETSVTVSKGVVEKSLKFICYAE